MNSLLRLVSKVNTMTQTEKEFKELDDLFWKLRKKFPNMILEWPKQVSKNRVDCKIRNLLYRNSLIRNVKNDIMHYLNGDWKVGNR